MRSHLHYMTSTERPRTPIETVQKVRRGGASWSSSLKFATEWWAQNYFCAFIMPTRVTKSSKCLLLDTSCDRCYPPTDSSDTKRLQLRRSSGNGCGDTSEEGSRNPEKLGLDRKSVV